MTAAERRDAIIESLSIHRHLKIECLMQRFGVCRRTINKDIVALSMSYPIFTSFRLSSGLLYWLNSHKPLDFKKTFLKNFSR